MGEGSQRERFAHYELVFDPSTLSACQAFRESALLPAGTVATLEQKDDSAHELCHAMHS